MKTKRKSFSREIATACALSLVMIIAISVVTSQDTSAATVSIKNFTFEPQNIEITSGQGVTWVNEDLSYHRIVGDNGDFESPILATGENYTKEFGQAGNYTYHCSIHPSMTGSIIVSGESVTNATELNQTVNETNETAPITNETNETEVNETSGNPTENQTEVNETTTPPAGISERTVEINSEGFEPESLTVTVGDTVEWINRDSTNHKLESDEFNSPDIPPGASYFFALKTEGIYKYTDVYTNMTGQIIVLAAVNETTNVTNQTSNQTNVTEPGNSNATRHVQKRYIVDVSSNAFKPQVVNGYVGDMVEWFNEENNVHQISSNYFRSINMTIGDAYGFVFTTPGTYGYSDGLYPGVTGTIVILPVAMPSDNTSQTPSGEGAMVRVEGFSFKPGTVTVNKGQNVTWTNEDNVYHKIKGHGFSSSKFGLAETVSVEMDELGIYNYRCTMHPTERGQIIVN